MSAKVTGEEGWVALENNYRHRYVSKVPSIAAGVIVSAVVLLVAAISLRQGVKWMSVWLWIGSAAVFGFAAAYFLNLYLECRHPDNAAYCKARSELSMGKLIDRAPSIRAVAMV